MPMTADQAQAQTGTPFDLGAYVDDPLLARVFGSDFDRIACVHMFGLLSRSQMNAGQDGVRDSCSKQFCDLLRHCDYSDHCANRSVTSPESIDHTICCFLQVHASDQHGSFVSPLTVTD